MAAAAGATIALVGWAVLVHIGAVSAGEWLGAWGIVLVAVFLSVSLLQRSNEFRVSISALREQAQHDGLTGLWNRRTFDTRLADEWLRHIRSQQPLGLIMVDVDHFKGYNDTLGHPAGDTVLRKIATVIDAHAKRSADIAARYGGEEFVLVLPHSDATGVYQVAERIRTAVEALQITHPVTAAGRVTVSVGASVYRPEAGQHGEASPLTLIEAADRALYEAKDAGRNAVRLQPVETGL
jgi:diguanylate cyclase (GGDEF)-like protein